MIKNVIFDLGNVILKDEPSVILENIVGLDNNLQDVKRKFFNNWNKLDLGIETLEEHLNNCKLNISIDSKLKEILLNYYKYRPFNNEIIKLMNNLKNNGYGIFILSNNNKEAYEYLKKLSLFKVVDGWIVSCDYHILKPNKEIYYKLFETFKIKPNESFFIDDKEENVNVAKTIGMNGFVLNIKNDGVNKLIESLEKNNIIL